jgi:hypothetical protein
MHPFKVQICFLALCIQTLDNNLGGNIYVTMIVEEE